MSAIAEKIVVGIHGKKVIQTRRGSKILFTPDDATHLPPLSEGCTIRSSGPREVLVECVPPVHGHLYTLCGHHDIYGRGGHSETVPHIDPFVLIHAINVPPRTKVPFCAHPHVGTEVASVLIQGEEIWPWDNINGFEAEKLYPGGIYHVSTGRGCVHDESLVPPFPQRAMTMANFDAENPRADNPETDEKLVKMLQIWWNSGVMYRDTMPRAKSQLVSPKNVPISRVDEGLVLRILHGRWDTGEGEVGSPAKQFGDQAVLLIHGKIRAGHESLLSRLPPEMNGGVFLLTYGDAKLGLGSSMSLTPSSAHSESSKRAGESSETFDPNSQFYGVLEATCNNVLALLPPGGQDLALHNMCGADVEFLIFMGEPTRKPYYKYVGYGGGLIHRSRELVESAMAVYEQDPKGFGRDDSSADIDWSSYSLTSGFQASGGPALERKELYQARFARVGDGEYPLGLDPAMKSSGGPS